MSLLLDALKKAAEQKARQAKAASDNNGDDKTVEVSADDTIVTDDSTIEYRERAGFSDDVTEISDDPTQEVTAAIGRDDDVTDVYDQDETLSFGEGRESTEDDTHLSDEKTIVESDAVDDEAAREDVTEHPAIAEVADDTEFDPITEYGSPEEDDTILDSEDRTQQVDQEQTVFESDAAGKEPTREDVSAHTAITDVVDDTEFDPLTDYDSSSDDTIIESEDQTQQSDVLVQSGSSLSDGDVTIRSGFDEDETAPIDADQDIADFMGDSIDDTTQSPGDPTQTRDEDTGHTGDPRDDMSLLLADGYDNDAGDDDSTTRRAPHLDGEGSNTGMETQGMVDQWQEAATQTSTITADRNDRPTPGVELESLRHENTIIRPDATSTHTYAPDNYDRTLIRPPSDDASRIFAGMKAEDDVLMTPDYAKRVFLSKSSANRMQHYKIYAGIGLSVFLAIGIFSMFELVDEYSRIDSTMLPLMRDPMPGVIRKNDNPDEVNVLDGAGQPDVDLETLKLVESAGAGAITEEAIDEEPEAPEEIKTSSGSSELQSQSDSASKDQNVAEARSNESPVERVSQSIPDEEAESSSSGSLQITSSSRVSQIDQWLTDGYAAYQRGDNETALANYARVIEIDSSNRNALLASAAIKVQNGNASSAISDYQKLLLANPKDTLAMSSLISISRTAPQESESQLKLMIREEPDSPHLNFVLANIYGAQNRWQEAQGLYFTALQNKPGDPNYAYNLAVSLEHISKPKAAIIYYERAIANIANGLATFDKDLVDSRIEMLKQL